MCKLTRNDRRTNDPNQSLTPKVSCFPTCAPLDDLGVRAFGGEDGAGVDVWTAKLGNLMAMNRIYEQSAARPAPARTAKCSVATDAPYKTGGTTGSVKT